MNRYQSFAAGRAAARRAGHCTTARGLARAHRRGNEGFTTIQPRAASPPGSRAFTLIELLVVISIVTLLMAILLPALGAARASARGAKGLSNIHQINIGLSVYLMDRDAHYPMHSSSTAKIAGTKPRWVDYLFPYMQSTEIYRSPNLSSRELSDFSKIFWHEVSVTGAEEAAATGVGVPVDPPPTDPATHGGFGYNFQYLGNARVKAGNSGAYHARLGADIVAPSLTVTIGDTAGSRKGDSSNEPGVGGAAVYVLDPPLGSAALGSRGSRKSSSAPGAGNAYYEGGSDEPGPTYMYRSFPATRNFGQANMGFADGHVTAVSLDSVDDLNGDGVKDNGYWNGKGDAGAR